MILGAGASYDSYDQMPPKPGAARPWYRPPLADELFLPNDTYRAISARYPVCQALFPRLGRLEPSVSVEEALEGYQNEAKHDAQRSRQILALRFYLRDLIHDCQVEWLRTTNGITNYKSLLDKLRKRCPFAIVTFNYDSMIEAALSDLSFVPQTIEDYVSRDEIRLFKLHGSVDWIHDHVCKVHNQSATGDQWLIQMAYELEPTPLIRRVNEHTKVHGTTVCPVPALAMPVVNKHGFACPSTHLDELIRLAPRVSKVLIIGWRAAEQHFMRILKNGLPPGIPVLAVCGSEANSQATLDRFCEAGIQANMRTDSGGFSDFVLSERFDNFLAMSAFA